MPIITPNYQIAAGNNNAGGLVRIDALSDANGVRFVMPRGVMNRNRGLRRFRLNETKIKEKWGAMKMSDGGTVWDNYERYLSTCVKAFANHWSSDVQMKLRQIPT